MVRPLPFAAACLAATLLACAVDVEERPAVVPVELADHACVAHGGTDCTDESLSLRQLRATSATVDAAEAREEREDEVSKVVAVDTHEASDSDGGDDRGWYFEVQVVFHVHAPGQPTAAAKQYRQKSWVTPNDNLGHAIRLAAQMQQNAEGYAWKNIYIEWNGSKRYQHLHQYQTLGSFGINADSVRSASIILVAEN
mmetsp:Transcript_54857/g.138609  ORF Transcript_54857/g.138609 Transcript_54857/m.138609 type:complete len:197 (-) Transcript_54857:88-678(-)